MPNRIYLDHNASTPVAPAAAEAMRPYLTEYYGNPSSPHWAGRPARRAFEHAREQVAALLDCDPSAVVFTSGGTESNNHVLKGTFFRYGGRGVHIITTRIEHPSIVEPCRFLDRQGAKITWLPVDATGRVDPADARGAIRRDTVLISVMHANNEVGTIQPIAEIADIAREHGVAFHTDAAQSAGKIPVAVDALGVDFLSIAGHKLYAPKGVGALYIRPGRGLEPWAHGAGHEGGRRAGTENVPLAVALGAACERALDAPRTEHMRELRDRFWNALRDRLGERVVLNGHPTERLPNTLNVNFLGETGGELLARLDGVAASTGSACHADRVELSPVLDAMGVDPEVGRGAVRFSLGRGTTAEEIDAVVAMIGKAVR